MSKNAGRIGPEHRRGLLALLEDTVDGSLTRFVWLRQFSPGNNSAAANRLLDRLEYLNRLECPDGLFVGVPAHRITRLRRQGERYYADGLRDLSENRRLAILAVCAAEWRSMLADTIVETHDRITGRTDRAAMRQCEARIADEATAAREDLTSFAGLDNALIEAHHPQGLGHPPGGQVLYRVRSEHYGVLGGIGFTAAWIQLGPRDRIIGWSADARVANTGPVVISHRFLQNNRKELERDTIDGADWKRQPGPNAEVVVAFTGSVAHEATKAVG